MENEKKLVIDYKDGEKNYQIFSDDFERIRYYCLNECMGIQFTISAEFLKKMVENLMVFKIEMPFSEKEFLSDINVEALKKDGAWEQMQKDFGTEDLKMVVRLVVKQTYNFLHKI